MIPQSDNINNQEEENDYNFLDNNINFNKDENITEPNEKKIIQEKKNDNILNIVCLI